MIRLNPFEVREVLQGQEGCVLLRPVRLNPFEVREVLQGHLNQMPVGLSCLNPFEVREVLQDIQGFHCFDRRCLNPFEVREVLQAGAVGSTATQGVSIPLKSGRCCKWTLATSTKPTMSQSL